MKNASGDFEKALRDRVASREPQLDGLTDAQRRVVDTLDFDSCLAIVRLIDEARRGKSNHHR